MNRKSREALDEAIKAVGPDDDAIASVRKIKLYGETITAIEWAFELGRASPDNPLMTPRTKGGAR